MRIKTGILITELPRGSFIDIENGTIDICFYQNSYSREQIRQLIEALTTALHLTDPVSERAPRVWSHGDPEPEIGTKVRDVDGDYWTRAEKGWTFRNSPGCPEDWQEVLRFAPLTEVIES